MQGRLAKVEQMGCATKAVYVFWGSTRRESVIDYPKWLG